ncbi:DDE-type integrase/transposase/recombinase [Streptomyces sp. NBC_00328]|uniref:DDE-type integrase/transposase/recombinase n=1 Tax=Streptomyces sp. NBC_00328 TaxID=2903646 RepID=UPI002E2AF9B2|nr:DDE-type integrase/transposase/recombinase [Streptomyces sp. NBC_00328]
MNDPYAMPNGVLRNKLGITDHQLLVQQRRISPGRASSCSSYAPYPARTTAFRQIFEELRRHLLFSEGLAPPDPRRLARLGEHRRASHGRTRPGRTEDPPTGRADPPRQTARVRNLVRRDFTADTPDQVWCGDMTETATGEGKLYPATVIDLFSRRLLGYAMSARRDAEPVVASLNMAAATRDGNQRRHLPQRQ